MMEVKYESPKSSEWRPRYDLKSAWVSGSSEYEG
jgi:hypothetical protein